MGLFGGFRRFRRSRRDAGGGDLGYLRDWVRARSGVEAYLEPQTTVTPMTVVLVAGDGEWTRRAVDPRSARRIGERLAIPVYDVTKLGYPQRMRDYDARRRIERRRSLRAELDGP